MLNFIWRISSRQSPKRTSRKLAFRQWLLVIWILASQLVSAQEQTEWAGVNLAGAEFAHGTFWPSNAEIDYFVAQGMNAIRLPFGWERLQPQLNQPFNSGMQASLIEVVDYATSKGATVILDPHNYARYQNQLIGSPGVPVSAFEDFWSRLAELFKNRPRVVFGLMNEPNTMPTEQWRDAANAAIAAIRAGDANNLILVPGNAWTGAHSWTQNWYGTSNATVMSTIVDPIDNFAFDLHQYFDGDFSGRSPNCAPGTGANQLTTVTQWLRDQGRQGVLGEFAGGNNPTCRQVIEQTIDYMNDNSDTWLGWFWWAAGPEWGEYIFTLEPTNNFTEDREQLSWLRLDQRGNTPDPGIFSDGFE